METSLFSQLQEAWFLSQLNRQSSSESSYDSMYSSSYSNISSPNLYWTEDYQPSLNDHTRSCSQLPVEVDLASYSMPLAQSSGFFAVEGPSPLDIEALLLHKSSSEDDMGNSGIAPFEEDVIMDPALDYINEILMEEGMEDRTCMQQDCITYQAIVNGFYEIIGEHSPDSSLDSSEDSSQPRLTHDSNKLLVEDDQYSWIGQVLNSNPSTPLPASSSSWVKESSAQIPANFQDDGRGSFMNAQIRQLLVNVLAASPSFQVNMSSGVDAASNSSSSDTAKTEGTLLQRKGNHTVSLINGELEDGGQVVSYSGGQLVDKTRYGWEEDTAAAAGRSGHSARAGQQQGNWQLPNGESPTDGDVSFVKNKYLKEYKNLYVGESLASQDKGSGASANGKKSSGVGSSKGKGKGNRGAAQAFVDLTELLVNCAQAVAGGDARKANELLQELRRHGASPNGSGLQRVAHYFSEALVARMCGTGGRLYIATSNNRPSEAKMLKVTKLSFEVIPTVKISHYFANQSILKAAEGASRLHVVDYGILYGMQWPYLINALADRKGGPPLLVITGIEFPHPGLNPAESVENTGRRLAEYARTYNVPFEYHAIATSKWEDVEPASLRLQQGEVLVVNCIKRLRHLLDESVVASSPRQKVLSRMRSLNPNLLVAGVLSEGYNVPFFVSRFREALYHHSNVFDMLDVTLGERPERMIYERDFFGRAILNIVACEGVERVERPETYRQWQARIQRAGFELLPIIPTIMSRSRSHVKNYYHKDFSVHDDDSSRWMLLGWKGRTAIALSAWKPIPT